MGECISGREKIQSFFMRELLQGGLSWSIIFRFLHNFTPGTWCSREQTSVIPYAKESGVLARSTCWPA